MILNIHVSRPANQTQIWTQIIATLCFLFQLQKQHLNSSPASRNDSSSRVWKLFSSQIARTNASLWITLTPLSCKHFFSLTLLLKSSLQILDSRRFASRICSMQKIHRRYQQSILNVRLRLFWNMLIGKRSRSMWLAIEEREFTSRW